jgi:hypothetical protein
MKRVCVMFLALAVLNACSGEPTVRPGLNAPHNSPVLGIHHLFGSNAAATHGKLVLHSGCVMLAFRPYIPPDGQAKPIKVPPEMLAWPKGFTVQITPRGFRVQDGEGRPVGVSGDRVRLGGGPIGPGAVHTADGGNLPSKCATKNVWAVDARSVR